VVEARSGPYGSYDRKTLTELYEMWRSVRKVSRITGIPPETLRYWYKKWKVKLKPRGGGDHRELERVAFLYERLGLSTGEIGEVLGIDQSTAWDRVKASGVEMRSSGQSVKLRFARRPRASGKPIEVAVR
jgi:DNA-binding transcriptional MerR regulator